MAEIDWGNRIFDPTRAQGRWTKDPSEQGYEPPHVCSICGKAANAYWHGDILDIAVCRECAVDVLPALVADAVTLSCEPEAYWERILREVLSRIEQGFWKGVALRLLRTPLGESKRNDEECEAAPPLRRPARGQLGESCEAGNRRGKSFAPTEVSGDFCSATAAIERSGSTPDGPARNSVAGAMVRLKPSSIERYLLQNQPKGSGRGQRRAKADFDHAVGISGVRPAAQWLEEVFGERGKEFLEKMEEERRRNAAVEGGPDDST